MGALDLSLAFIGIALIAWVLMATSAPIPIRLGLAADIALLMWAGWKGQQFFRAARALATCAPRAFVAVAIENLRAQLRFSRFGLWSAAPLSFLTFILTAAAVAPARVDLILTELTGTYLKETMLFVAGVALVLCYFMRDHFKLRAQLRSLEAISLELEGEHARDLSEEGDR